jgi:hypothetical protein
MQKRRWGGYKKGSATAASSSHTSPDPSAASFHTQPEHKSAVRSQLAGLRHRAAIRANRQGPRWTAAAAAEAAAQAERDSEQQEQPEAMASLEYDSTEMSDGCNMSSGAVSLQETLPDSLFSGGGIRQRNFRKLHSCAVHQL